MKILEPKMEVNTTYNNLKLLNLDLLIDLEYKKLAYKISKHLLPKKMLEMINCDQNNQTLQKKTQLQHQKKRDA